MKKNYSLLIVLILFCSAQMTAQNWVLNQVIVGSGGNFSNPDDNVVLSSYLPSNASTSDFGSILTHSIQDIKIVGNYAYIAAQDSLAKYNIDTYERVSIVEAIGVNRLVVGDGVVLASFQYPVTEDFVRFYSSEDLTHITSISGISGEAGGLLIVDELAYAAVHGGWASSEGKIAIIQISDFSLVKEVNLGVQGKGIMDLFHYNNLITGVNITPWGDSISYITTMNGLGSNPISYLIPDTIGGVVGVEGDVLFTIMNEGIGAISLIDFSVINSSLIDKPSMSIATAKLDTVNYVFYVTTTDYFSSGEGIIYDFLGEVIGSFDAGISPDAIALDYRDNTSVYEKDVVESYVYPNPSSRIINITTELEDILEVYITHISGRAVFFNNNIHRSGNITIDISQLDSGIYLLNLKGKDQISIVRFIKN